MNKQNAFFKFILSAATCLAYVPLALQAQNYPTKPIRVVAASGPGSGIDINARIVAPSMSKALGQTVVVENLPGGGGVIAMKAVVRSPADGYTLLIQANNNPIAALFVKDSGLDVQKDFAPIANISDVRIVLYSNMSTPWTSMQEMVNWAKANPGKLNAGVYSPNDMYALVGGLLGQRYGIPITGIYYSGAGPAMNQALRTNDVHFIIDGETSARVAREGNWGRMLAITGKERSASYPEVPTFMELGFPEVSSGTIMMFGVAGTPRPIIDKLNAAVKQSLQDPDVLARLAKVGFSPVGSSPEATSQYLAIQISTYSAVAQKLGIKPE
jgi:tripartite-type tricarboxylate transporter receptor subunit TctC